MKSGTVDVSVPDGFEETVSTTAGELADQVRLMAALKMFEPGKLSSIHEGFRDTSSLRSGRSPETTSSLRSGRRICSHEERPEREREEGTFRPSRAYYPVVQYSHNA